MALASTSSVGLTYLEESTYGTTPETGTSVPLRITGEDLSFDFTTETSKEINNTRQSPDSILVNASAAGGFNFELSYSTFDDFLEALLASTFDTSNGTAGVLSIAVTADCTVSGTGGTITAASGSWADLPTAPFWIAVAGSGATVSGTSNAGAYLVTTKSDTMLTLSSATALATDITDTITISNCRLTNGVADQRSFSIEKSFEDVDQYFMHTGRVPSKLDLSFSTGAVVTGTIGFLGSTAVRADATQFVSGVTAGTATSYGMMNTVTGVGALSIKNPSGTELLTDTFVQSMKVSIDGALREQKAIGTLGAVGIGVGTFKIGGTAEIYLKTGAIYDAALADQLLSVTFPVTDSLGNGYGFTFNNVKFKVPKVVAGGQDADVMMSVEFTAVAPNTSTDKMICIDRIGEAIA